MTTSIDSAEAEFPVQKQLEAYNARDIDAFMQWWAEDCEYYEFPSKLLAHGAAAIRERHVTRFKEPNLHGTLGKRIAVANVIVDQETVTRTFIGRIPRRRGVLITAGVGPLAWRLGALRPSLAVPVYWDANNALGDNVAGPADHCPVAECETGHAGSVCLKHDQERHTIRRG